MRRKTYRKSPSLPTSHPTTIHRHKPKPHYPSPPTTTTTANTGKMRSLVNNREVKMKSLPSSSKSTKMPRKQTKIAYSNERILHFKRTIKWVKTSSCRTQIFSFHQAWFEVWNSECLLPFEEADVGWHRNG